MEIGVREIDLEDTFDKCNEDEYSTNKNGEKFGNYGGQWIIKTLERNFFLAAGVTVQ